MEEFKMVAKVSAVGVLILGFMGFLINMIINLIIWNSKILNTLNFI